MLRKCNKLDMNYFLTNPVLMNHTPLLAEIKKTFLPGDEIFFIKAPGRVNLIGEHTDYNMGPVLPCAINKEIVFCIHPTDTAEIRVSNLYERYVNVHFSLKEVIEPFKKGHWGNYIKAGVKGIVDYLKSSAPHRITKWKGCDIIVSSTLPPAAGVSSSSALVVASALTFVEVNRLAISKKKIAEICAGAEHFVGTAGGGMDQAASLLGKENSFLNMEFNPLKIKPIKAPEGIRLVLFSSLIQAEKSGKLRKEYNRRVLECKMGMDAFNRYFKSTMGTAYTDINYIGEIKPENLNTDQGELDRVVGHFLDDLKLTYSIKEFLIKLDMSEQEFKHRYQHVLHGTDSFTEPPDGFKIKSRFKHVYSECRRVNQTVTCLRNNKLADLGLLINQSHDSLSMDYEVSTPEVDNLVNILRENGALGARIMGAGFGGMVLAYSDSSKMDFLIEQTKKKFYDKQNTENQTDLIIPCVTADGAGVL